MFNTSCLVNSHSCDITSPEASFYNFEIKNDLLLASWPFEVRAESSEFFDSILILFRLIKEKTIKKLLLDSGTPDGGILTEEVVAFVEQEVFLSCPLQKVALLESVDFHWDNNIIQFINYLKLTFDLKLSFRIFASKEAAVTWLKEDKLSR